MKIGPTLPPTLAAEVAELLVGKSRKDIAARTARISQTYRGGGGSSEAIGGRDDAIAYVLARLPATYAAVVSVLSEAADRAPSFAPRTLLDIGTGPGTASFAALECWPQIGSVAMLDRSEIFLKMAAQLARNSTHQALVSASGIKADILRDENFPQADLVVAGYALAELARERIGDVAAKIWHATQGVLVIVEPGTPAGFSRILDCRAALLAQGATILAPCPHAQDCPVTEPDWCHFSARLPRSRDHMIAKDASVPFEDEKFSYLVAARDHVLPAPAEARVLAPPHKSKIELRLKLCRHGAVEQRAIARRDRDGFAKARRLDWGDAI